jgi:thymidylate synthase (FAD)
MKIIEPSFDIVDPQNQAEGIKLLQKIERMARISHRSEEKQTTETWEKFIRAVVVGHGDYSVIEHASATVIFRVDRGITHELVRHRLFSFTQESTRFVNGRKSYPDGLEFIFPINFPRREPISSAIFPEDVWRVSMNTLEDRYFKLLDSGVRPQEARSILPNSLAATIAVTGNLRNWRHFFLMRTSKETHPDFRRVTIPLLEQFQQLIPILYEDIVPNARQIDNLRAPR